MITIQSDHCVVMKTLNNNSVVAMEHDVEKVIIAKGIAFKAKPGMCLPRDMVVEKIFSISNEDIQVRYNQLLEEMDASLIGVCTEAIHTITEKTGVRDKLSETALLSITDHMAFAIERLRRDETIRNPFIHEVRILYPEEFKIATEAAQWLGSALKIVIPDHEIGFIAMHIHSLLTNREVSHTLLMDTVIMEVNEIIRQEVGSIDFCSLEYARFITHMRFVINRLVQGAVLVNELKDLIAKSFHESYLLAERIAQIMQKRLKKAVSSDEIAYIAIHIENFRHNRRNGG